MTAARPSSPAALLAWLDALPREQEAREVRGADRLDFGAEPVERVAVNAGQQPALAPLELGAVARLPA